VKVLHVLHHSTPYQDGYCIRSKQIVDFQRSIGLDVEVVTSPQHEVEVERPVGSVVNVETIDGVTYHRTPVPRGAFSRCVVATSLGRRLTFMRELQARVHGLVRDGGIDVVHAHSPVLCGWPALRAAAFVGTPMVYEVRGFWEDGFISKWAGGERSWQYRLSRSMETKVLHGADAALAISRGMLEEVADRGIDRNKLFRVPNGVDPTLFTARPRDEALVDRLGLRGTAVAGFIGSLYAFEGLECLVEAMSHVRRSVPEARLVVVGGGEQEHVLPTLVEKLGLRAYVTLVGRVPHREVGRYYSLMDVLVYPRVDNRTTRLTTPLKPLEAMAMGKAVVGSDVGGIREILDDGRAGLLFKAGDSRDLARRLEEVFRNPSTRLALGQAGQRFALQERSWTVLVRQYEEIYRGVVSGRRRDRKR
jgi:PEP-CTERM/exosortase A-associated glycosyltransferase